MAERRVDVSTAPMDVAARETNRVLKNTYMLLGMTLAFSAVTATISTLLMLPFFMYWVFALSGLVLLFVVHKMADSAKGLPAIFAFTGVMGLALGPLLNIYLAVENGPNLVLQSLGGTALIFFGLSAYALQSKRDFTFMSGFLFAGLLVAIFAAIANIFLGIPALSLTISAAIVMMMAGYILMDTSRIVHGGETNYIRATVGLYLNIFNLFINLLHLLGAFGGDD